jgi:hypothetical protein
MAKKKRTVFPKEFKLEAVLINDPGPSIVIGRFITLELESIYLLARYVMESCTFPLHFLPDTPPMTGCTPAGHGQVDGQGKHP